MSVSWETSLAFGIALISLLISFIEGLAIQKLQSDVKELRAASKNG